jgi:hypothetical protein
MPFSEDQIKELKAFGTVTSGSEGGITYFRIAGLGLPELCSPSSVDALLCPQERDGYKFRLYFASVITGPLQRNWNGQNVRILEENWFAFSLTVPTGLRLAQMVSTVLKALVK